jgi:hypothetical protein
MRVPGRRIKMVDGEEKRASIASANKLKTVSRAKMRRKNIVLEMVERREDVVSGLEVGGVEGSEED